jgi:hypothetical protein
VRKRKTFCLISAFNIYIEFNSRQWGIFADAFHAESFRAGASAVR